jgi:hypothetical protein
VEDKERDEDEAQAELYIIQRTIVRLARTGDVDGLIALLESIEEEEQNRAGHSDTQAWKEGQSSSTTPHDHLLNFIFDLPTRPTAHRRTHTERRARRRVQTSTSEAEAEAEEELEPCEDERHGAEAGCTPLFVAALNGRAQMVQLLLERGARPGLRSTRGGVHPLYAACLEGHADVVRVLLSSGGDAAVDVNEIGVEADGSTALMGCCEGGHTALARLLLNRGADVGARGRSGATALFYATQQGHDHVVRLLASHHRCDVNARKNDGSTALFLGIITLIIFLLAFLSFSSGHCGVGSGCERTGGHCADPAGCRRGPERASEERRYAARHRHEAAILLPRCLRCADGPQRRHRVRANRFIIHIKELMTPRS